MEPVGILHDRTVDAEFPAQMWSIGGGKGGVGKSVVAVALAYWLGRMNRSVILVDGDLGGANLHTLLGIRVPKFTLEDFLLHRVRTLEETLLPTPFEGVQLLSGGSEVSSLANPNYGQKTRILRGLARLQADHILVDLGAGTSLNVLDFFLASPQRLVVVSPQPTSVQNAYGFIKSALYRSLARNFASVPELNSLLNMQPGEEALRSQRTMPEALAAAAEQAPESAGALRDLLQGFHISLVVNMVRSEQEAKVGAIVQQVCQRYLSVDVEMLGALPTDASIERWASRMDPDCFVHGGQDGALSAAYQLAYRVLRTLPQPARHGDVAPRAA